MISTKRILTSIATLFISTALMQPAYSEVVNNVTVENKTKYSYKTLVFINGAPVQVFSLAQDNDSKTFNGLLVDSEYYVQAKADNMYVSCNWTFNIDSEGNISDTATSVSKGGSGYGYEYECIYDRTDEHNLTLKINHIVQ